jgi:hypothetical protein
MNVKKFLISELEKKDILKQYGILSEAAPTPATPTPEQLTIDKRVVFPAGYYNESYILKTELPTELTKVVEFLKNKPGKSFIVDVRIESGESQIPNTDNELKKPSPDNRVGTGYLSKMRANTITSYIYKVLEPYIGPGKVLPTEPKIIATAPKIGETKWKDQAFCPSKLLPANDTQGYECFNQKFNPGTGVLNNWFNGKDKLYSSIKAKYLEEQYIRVIIKVGLKDDPKTCLDNMVVEVNYTNLALKHKCNSAIYEIYIKGNLSKSTPGVLLYRNDGKQFASLNNNYPDATKDGGPTLINYDNDPKNSKAVGGVRYNKFVVTPEIADSLITDGSTSFIISAKCLNPFNNTDWSGGCHKGVGNIVITNGKSEKTPYESSTPNGKDEVKELVSMNACGKGVAK